MTKTIFSAKEAKNNFGKLLDEARKSPVTINKNGRNVVVVLSSEDYEALEQKADAYWIMRAKAAERGGFVGTKKSMKLINDVINA